MPIMGPPTTALGPKCGPENLGEVRAGAVVCGRAYKRGLTHPSGTLTSVLNYIDGPGAAAKRILS